MFAGYVSDSHKKAAEQIFNGSLALEVELQCSF
jgi:hypothetical protein